MTASPSKALAAALAVWLAAATPAPAQTAGEVTSEPLGPPVQLTPLGDPSAPADNEQRRDAQGIQINPLAATANDAVGSLEPAEGGFGPQLWEGMSRSQVVRAIPKLSALPGSAVLREIQRRLLLTAARAPVEQGVGQPTTDLVSVRAERLWAMGELDGLADLLKLLPLDAESEWLTRTRAEVNLLRRDDAAACEAVNSGALLYPEEPFWQEAQAYCQLQAGNQAAALLSLDLLREMGAESDPEVLALVEAVLGYRAPPSLSSLSPLKLALLGLTEAEAPMSLLHDASPAVLAALIRTSNLPLDTRVLVAEAAAALGFVTGGEVAELYAAYEFAPQEFTALVEGVPAEETPRGRALLFQAASRAGVAATRAELADAYLEAMRAAGAYTAGAKVILPVLRQAPATPEMIWYADAFGQALFMLGRFELASLWYALANQQQQAVNLERDVVTRLWPYAQLGGVGAPATAGDIDTWALRRAASDAQKDAADKAFLTTMLNALSENSSLQLAGGLNLPQVGDDRRLAAIDAASRARRLGDTLLQVLTLTGERTPGSLADNELAMILRALSRVGLSYEARILAIEAAAERGL